MRKAPSKPKVELSSELAERLIKPLLETLEIEAAEDECDEVARAIGAIICALAHEEDKDMRESFAEDLLAAIYAKTAGFEEATRAFTEFVSTKYLELVI